MRIRMLVGLIALVLSVLLAPLALAQPGGGMTKRHTTHHSASWYKTHKHSASWYRTHNRKHSAAWYRTHRRSGHGSMKPMHGGGDHKPMHDGGDHKPMNK